MGAAVFKFHSGYIYTKGTTKEATITAFFKFHSGYIYTEYILNLIGIRSSLNSILVIFTLFIDSGAYTVYTNFKFHSGYIYTETTGLNPLLVDSLNSILVIFTPLTFLG